VPCAGVTAWNALFVAAAPQPGDTVLLLGTGGVSIWALQLAKAAGLRVIITSSDDAKLQAARSLGADATVNYGALPDWAARVHELTHGRGADLVLDTAGRETLAQSMRALRPGGTVAYIGGTTGFGGEIDADAMIDGALRIVGVLVGSRSMVEDLVRFVEQTGLRPVIDRAFGFADLRADFRYLASARHVGKVVVDVGAADDAAVDVAADATDDAPEPGQALVAAA
jgi:NADPH:quinone reductase-like Zn-dependent oxidoreductase